MKNPWISYVGRSYSTIKSSLINSLSTKLPELTDRSPSNLLVVLLDVFASVSEVLNYYIDNTARELYPITARRMSSMLKLAHFVNYKGKGRIPSSCDVIFTISEAISDSDYIIPALTELSDSNGNTWLTTQARYISKGALTVLVPVSQIESVNTVNFKVGNGLPFQRYELPQDYANETLEVVIEGDTWTRRDVLGFSNQSDKHFTVELYADNKVYLVFGDGVNGAIPENNSNISISYYRTRGAEGNIPQNQIENLESTLVIPGGRTLSVTNSIPAYGGSNKEDLNKLRRSIPRSLRTLNRAVTRKDYEDTASLAPGVRVAKLEYQECDDQVSLYIVPNEGGIPSTELLDSVKDYVEERGIFTIKVSPKPSGESLIRLTLTIRGEYGISSSTISSVVTNILSDLYNPQTSEINTHILLSDIISAVHNLKEVNNVILDNLSVRPYLRPDPPTVWLDYDIRVLAGANVKKEYWISYDQNSNMVVFDNSGLPLETISPGQFGEWVTVEEGVLEIKIIDYIASGTETSNITWNFTIYPNNTNIELDDFSIPVLDIENLVLNINENVPT